MGHERITDEINLVSTMLTANLHVVLTEFCFTISNLHAKYFSGKLGTPSFDSTCKLFLFCKKHVANMSVCVLSVFLEELENCDMDPVKIAKCFVDRKEGFVIYTDYCTNYPRYTTRQKSSK